MADQCLPTIMSPWQATNDPMMLRRMGKTGEEAGELLAVTSRIIIQGIDEIDPSSGKTNRQRLQEEIADVYAQLDCTIDALYLDLNTIMRRRSAKVEQMLEWEELLQAGADTPQENTDA
jgi:NTP pyrophosphatase (non-canonical NTP hydrolase)